MMMQRSWKQSLAGAVLFAALVTASDAPRAQGPAAGGGGAEKAADVAPPPAANRRLAKESDAALRAYLEKNRSSVDALRNAQEEMKKAGNGPPDKERQLEALQKQIELLTKGVAEIEQELRERARRIRVFRLKYSAT